MTIEMTSKIFCAPNTAPTWPDGIWVAPEYTAADIAYKAALEYDINDRMSALSIAVDAGIAAYLERTSAAALYKLKDSEWLKLA